MKTEYDAFADSYDLEYGQTRVDLDEIHRGGYWAFDSYHAGATASAIQAFEVHGHLETSDPTEDPYVETVRRGMNYLSTDRQ